MVALWNWADHYIFILWFLLSSSIFPRLILAVADWMSATYFHTWCGLSANVRCSSETCCTGLAEIQDAKKSPKITIWATSHNLSGYIFATAARIDNRKNLSNSSMFSRCRHNIVNFGPLAAEVSSGVWGTPTNFNGFRLGSVAARYSSKWASAKLCGVEQRAPPIFGRATITLGIGPHSSFVLFLSFFFLFVPRLISAVADWISTILLHAHGVALVRI